MAFRTNWDEFRDWLSLNHQNAMNCVRGFIGVLILFGFVSWDDKQIIGVLGLFETFAQTLAAKNTVPKSRVDMIVDKKVTDILSSPEEVRARGTGSGV